MAAVAVVGGSGGSQRRQRWRQFVKVPPHFCGITTHTGKWLRAAGHAASAGATQWAFAASDSTTQWAPAASASTTQWASAASESHENLTTENHKYKRKKAPRQRKKPAQRKGQRQRKGSASENGGGSGGSTVPPRKAVRSVTVTSHFPVRVASPSGRHFENLDGGSFCGSVT
ncbi:hypothetical protein R3P38DRAFT_2793573 [Favolaschia claudopus]|uniref:Uncharacterized protein n=1 Tax=Favolaschia claudopus TaxID=2862362 RepID=A0AAW0AD11_9AGAR